MIENNKKKEDIYLKKTAKITMLTVVLYGIVVSVYYTFKTEFLLTLWELLIVLSAFVISSLIIKLSKIGDAKYSKLIIRFAKRLVLFSTLAHTINLFITRPLIASGKNIPTYYQIGYWFSFETLIDNIGWGLCLGFAFILLFQSLKKVSKALSVTSLIIGILCVVGFIGCLWNFNLWFFAPAGYVFVLMILCIEILYSKSIK